MTEKEIAKQVIDALPKGATLDDLVQECPLERGPQILGPSGINLDRLA